MTGPEERALLRQYVETLAHYRQSFADSVASVEHLMPMDVQRIDRLQKPDSIYSVAFLKTFEQFEDVLRKTMKTIVQILKFGLQERLYPRDVANEAEALGIIENAEDWADAVRARNALAHEYPLQPEKRVAAMNAAWNKSAFLLDVETRIQDYVRKEDLI